MIKRFLFPLLFLLSSHSFAAVLPISDVNGYISLNDEPFLNSGDTCLSGRTCHSPPGGALTPTCDATIVSTDSEATLESVINTTTDGNSDGDVVICVSAGTYNTAAIDITRACSEAVPCWLIYKRGSDTDDDPWNMSAANKATFQEPKWTGASYWRVHRIHVDGNFAARVQVQTSSTFNIFNRVLIERTNGTAWGISTDSIDNMIQNSVIRTTQKVPNADKHCIAVFQTSSRTKVVNNEIYDCAGDGFQTNTGAPCADCIVENNDIYQTSDYYCDPGGAPNPNGTRSAGEQGFDIKEGGQTLGKPIKIIQNRIWGWRRTDSACGSTGSAGEGGVVNGLVAGTRTDVLVKNNIFHDIPRGISIDADTYKRVSVIGNIFYDMVNIDANARCLSPGDADTTEVVLNTCIVAASAWTSVGMVNSDNKCNVVIDTGNISGTPATTGEEIDFNVYYGVSGTKLDTTFIDKTLNTRVNSTAYSLGDIMRVSSDPVTDCPLLTGGILDQDCYMFQSVQAGTSAGSIPTFRLKRNSVTTDGTVKWVAIRGPLVHLRKLRTVAAGQAFVIPYAKPLKTSVFTVSELNSCPATCGDRTGIGIDDTLCSSHLPDLLGGA